MIRLAEELAGELGWAARWFCADATDPPDVLAASADLVYTGKGSLPWIMDLDAWAAAIHRVLKPGGCVYVFEGHPLDNLWDREASTLELRDDGVGYFDAEARENPGFPAAAVLFWDQFPNWSERLTPRLPHSYSLRYRLPADAASGTG